MNPANEPIELESWFKKMKLGEYVWKVFKSEFKHPNDFLTLNNEELEEVCNKSMMDDREKTDFKDEIKKMKVHFELLNFSLTSKGNLTHQTVFSESLKMENPPPTNSLVDYHSLPTMKDIFPVHELLNLS